MNDLKLEIRLQLINVKYILQYDLIQFNLI